MEEIPLTRAYLESLTTDDLIKMADNLGIDVPNDPDRLSIIEELLEISSTDKSDTVVETNVQDSDLSNFNLVESAPLPKQYNITFIDVMIRDPLWAFVFWEIKTQDKEQFEKAPDFTGYYLKVSPCFSSPFCPTENNLFASTQGAETEKVFSVSVSPNDTAWYLGLNPAVAEEIPLMEQIQYKVELCVGFGHRSETEGETVLAVSNPIRLPGLPEMPRSVRKNGTQGASVPDAEAACPWENPLVRLSGYGDFHIIRRNERPPREKRGESTGSHE